VSYPKRVIHGVNWNPGLGIRKRAAICRPVKFFDFVYYECRFQVPRCSGGGQNPQSPCPGDRTRPVVDAELAVDIPGVGLDRVQREEEPGCDFWIG
jgi:hypothetical protein